MLRHSRHLFLLLALVVIPSTAAASAGISVYRYPGVFSNPWTPISIDYHITADWNWCPWTEYGPPNIYLDYVEIAGSNGFNQISYSPSGSFYDSSPKPKEDISYSVSARLLCSDWDGSPDWGSGFWIGNGTGVGLRLTIDKVGFLGHSAHEFFFSVPNTFCTLTQQSNGFTAMWWTQHFLMKDAWDEIFLDEFLALELKETQPLDPCEYPPEPPPFWAYIPAGSGVLTDTHTVQHPNCCDVCACYQESAASWTGRSNGAQMWLLDNYWAENCFWYAFTYILRN